MSVPRLPVRVLETGEETTIADIPPLDSVPEFLATSDCIWRRRSHDQVMSSVVLSSTIETPVAVTAANDMLATVDSQLCLAGDHEQTQNLARADPNHRALAAQLQEGPDRVLVGTFWYDKWNTGRTAVINGTERYVKFTDGHLDFTRSLFIRFIFNSSSSAEPNFLLQYEIYRSQIKQDCLAELTMSLLEFSRAEMGSDGDRPYPSHTLSVKQELAFVSTVQTIGELSID